MSTVAVVVAATTRLSAQTPITAPPNKYTPAQDVELGVKAAAAAEQQMPVLRDDHVSSYVEGIGRRLVDAIPPELRYAEFRYSFKVVNVREINAFALPRGPMYVNRGMIEAARNEGEVAGVMAHELSHVVLRHGTAQASKAAKYEVGQVAGAVLGAIIGGGWGRVIAEGTQFGSAPRFSGSAANSSGTPTSKAHTSWGAPATTRWTWRGCSRRSKRRAPPAIRSG